MSTKSTHHWILLVIGVCVITFLPRIYNFAGFPKFIADEGIYVSQAWWLAMFGKLGPYTYWYDHSPVGWLIIGLWQRLTGGPFTFGISILSGRILCIIAATISNVYLFKLTHKITQSTTTALLASTIFGFSTLSVLLTRQVYLENLALPWLVAAVYTLYASTKSGKNVLLSAFLWGIGVLIKESLIVFLPAFLLLLYQLHHTNRNAKYLYFGFLSISVFVIAMFFAGAFLKTELFPHQGQVSLIGTLASQLGRGDGLNFWESGSDLRRRMDMWLYFDPYLIFIGFFALIINLLRYKQSNFLSLHLFSLSFLLFLLRGKLVLDFYIIPLLPFFAFEIAVFLAYLAQTASVKFSRYVPILLPLIALGYVVNAPALYRAKATANQISAIHDVQSLPKNSVVLVDPFMYLDLRFTPTGDDRISQVHWYHKAENDPEVRQNVLHNNPSAVTAIVSSRAIQEDLDYHRLPFIQSAIDRMQITKTYDVETDLQPLAAKVAYVAESLELFQPTASQTKNTASTDTVSLTDLGQLIYINLNTPKLPEASKKLITDYAIRGVIISASAVENTVQLENLVTTIKNLKSTTPPLIFIQQASGADNPIPWINTITQSSIKSPLEGYEVGLQRGGQLKNLKIDGVISPLFDQSLVSLETGYEMIRGYQESGLRVIPILGNLDRQSLAQVVANPFVINSSNLIFEGQSSSTTLGYSGLVMKFLPDSSVDGLKTTFLSETNTVIISDDRNLTANLESFYQLIQTDQALQQVISQSLRKIYTN